MPLIHQIEDLQFVCFALVFGVMALQSRRDNTVRYVWCSYLVALLVAVVDVFAVQPLSLLTNSAILTILSFRYAILAAGIGSFTGRARWPAVMSLAGVGVACCMLCLAPMGVSRPVVLSGYYVVLAIQLVLICGILVRSREQSTRVPRWLLAALFFISAIYRVNQMIFVQSAKTPHDVWLKDVGSFLNSTILGCLLPFTIVWMMNARDQAILLKQSLLDPLTNLLNRRGLADAVARELARYAREQNDFAVAVADIDCFKRLNDTYGHHFGDEVLVITAGLLRQELRLTDVVARTGGEEFVLLMPLTNRNEMMAVLERLRVLLAQQLLITEDGSPTKITISIGVTNSSGRTGLSWSQLQKEADSALYAAKQGGRNRVVRAADGDPGELRIAAPVTVTAEVK